jgi:phosphatidylinositol kinase/protein kinase (PI-3  family)
MSVSVRPLTLTSDGLEYPFLAKPKDDLRKDYRLMELAGTLNALFAREPQASWLARMLLCSAHD